MPQRRDFALASVLCNPANPCVIRLGTIGASMAPRPGIPMSRAHVPDVLDGQLRVPEVTITSVMTSWIGMIIEQAHARIQHPGKAHAKV
jgi:hypothetical protein